MRIAVPNEARGLERRVALVPDVIKLLVAKGHEIQVESGAGSGARIPDTLFELAGARVFPAASALEGADVVVRVGLSTAEVESLPDGSTLVGFLAPLTSPATTLALAAAGTT